MNRLPDINDSSSVWDTFGPLNVDPFSEISHSLLETSERVQGFTDLSQIPSYMSSSSSSDPFPGARAISLFDSPEPCEPEMPNPSPDFSAFTTPDCFDSVTSSSVNFSTSNSANSPFLNAAGSVPFSSLPRYSFGDYFTSTQSALTADPVVPAFQLPSQQQGSDPSLSQAVMQPSALPLALPPTVSQVTNQSSSHSSSSSTPQTDPNPTPNKSAKRKVSNLYSKTLSKEDKKRLRTAANRQSAAESRQRKKEHVKGLEISVKSLSKENEVLKKHIELSGAPSSGLSLAERILQLEKNNTAIQEKNKHLTQQVETQRQIIADQNKTIKSLTDKLLAMDGDPMILPNRFSSSSSKS